MQRFVFAMAGFGLAVGLFASGSIAATAMLSAAPERQAALNMDTSCLWSDVPVKVATDAQDFERLAPAAAPPAPQPKKYLDAVFTASASRGPIAPEEPVAAAINAEHVAWCERRYRSYRASDNTYAPYRGGRRECESPYAAEQASYVEATLAYDAQAMAIDADHVQSCFDRYRSYRPDDNTYQPYSGGPRRQCE